jgi:hypothetical protein
MSIIDNQAPARNGESANVTPWPDDTITDFEYVEPSPDPQHSAYEPTASDWAEAEAAHEEMIAERVLNRRGVPLAELVEVQEAFYRSWQTDAGNLLADHLGELAGLVRSTGADNAVDFLARDELLVKWLGEDRQ